MHLPPKTFSLWSISPLAQYEFRNMLLSGKAQPFTCTRAGQACHYCCALCPPNLGTTRGRRMTIPHASMSSQCNDNGVLHPLSNNLPATPFTSDTPKLSNPPPLMCTPLTSDTPKLPPTHPRGVRHSPVTHQDPSPPSLPKVCDWTVLFVVAGTQQKPAKQYRWGAPYKLQLRVLFTRTIKTRRFEALSTRDFLQFLIVGVLAGNLLHANRQRCFFAIEKQRLSAFFC